MSQRGVVQIVNAHRQQEGGGFVVRRPFPSASLRYADPFVLLDEIGASRVWGQSVITAESRSAYGRK
jgi:hypothetical protein